VSRRRGGAGWRRSQARCRRCYIGSSRCAIGCRLRRRESQTAGGQWEGRVLGHTKLKSLAFFQDLRKTVSARNGLAFLHVYIGAPRRSPCKGRRHPRRPWATRGLATPWLLDVCGGVSECCWWCGVAQQWGLPARLTRASRGRGVDSSRADERSRCRPVRCRVVVVLAECLTPPRG
jgi:hypothetical protein